MRVLRPDLAVWLWVVPLLAAAWAVRILHQRRARARVAVSPRFAALSRRAGLPRRVALLAVSLLTAGLLVLAILRPQMRLERRLPEFERHDLIVILDRSASMRARDVRPSRIERAVLELKNFLRHKPDAIDRVGLVGFAGSSVVLSYLTRDVESLMFYLDWIEEDVTPFFGTDIGAALISALEVERKDARSTHKIFLIISDGDDQGRDLPRMLARMRADKRRVHTIGIGSDEEALMPIAYGDRQEEFLRDDNGDLLTTRFSEQTLRTVAVTTGGRYYRSTSGTELLTALQTIVRGEQRQVGWQTVTDDYDLHHEALLAAGMAAAFLVLLL